MSFILNNSSSLEALKKECVSAIKSINAENKTLSSKGTRHITSFSLVGTLALITGIALTIIGSILCATGAGLPVGVTLLCVGIPLAIGSLCTLYKAGIKIGIQKKIDNNKEKIRKIKLLQDIKLLKFVQNLRKEMGADFLTTAEFATKTNMTYLKNIHNQYKSDQAKVRYDQNDPTCVDYNSKFDLMWGQINLANTLLQELNEKVGQAEAALKKTPKHPNKMRLERDIDDCLAHALKIKTARARIFRDRPGAAKMSNSGFGRIKAIEMIAYKGFTNLDPH